MSRVALALFLFSAAALACPDNAPKESLKHAVAQATYVLLGRITGLREDKKRKVTLVTLRPYVRWKAPIDDRLNFEFESATTCDIGHALEKNTPWLIVAGEDKKVLTGSHSHRIWNLVEQQNLRTQVTTAVGHSSK